MTGTVLLSIPSLTLRMHAAEALSAAGLRVLAARNRQEALNALGAGELPSLLVVTDEALEPGGLVRELRRENESLPVLVLASPGEVRNDLLRSSRVELLSPSEVDSRLPARARALMGPGAQPLRPRAGPHRVLVVDDSETFLQRVAASLREEGYTVSLARSGDEALATLDEQTKGGASPDAILLDMVMPGLSGDETCRRIKANPQWRPIPVVVHTGRDDPRAILDALNAGADDFVAKSSDDTILRARLRAQLRRKESEDESRRIRERLLESELEIARARADRELARTRERLLADLARKNEELVREKERAEGILESITDAFLSVGPDWRLEYLNREAERLLGRERKEALGRSLWTELPQLAGGGFEKRLRAAMETRSEVEFEEPVPALGAWFEVRVYSAAEGLSVYFRDVSARRRTTENRLLLLEVSANLARSLDFDRTLDTVARQLLGPFAELCVVHLEHPEYGRRTVLTHVDPKQEAWAMEQAARAPSPLNTPRAVGLVMRSLRPDVVEIDEDTLGDVTPLNPKRSLLRILGIRHLLAVPLVTRGKAFGALVFCAGPERHPYDEEDVAFALEIAGRASLALENARLYRQSQEAVRLRDEFLAIASHELRTPLTALRLLLQSQLRYLQRVGSKSVPASSLVPRLERADSQSLRLSKLVENLLDITRLTANRLVLDYGQADLAGIVRDVTERYESELRQAGCTLDLRADRPVVGRWDVARLDQVVTNLLTNAIKYGRDGTITVTVTGDAEHARLTVQDEGIGIAPEDHERIFQRFARGVSEQHYGGFGLGLWIVRHLVEAHGGTIRVESRRGAGATFHVELPRDPPPTRRGESSLLDARG